MLALTTYEPPPTIRALDKETVASGGAVSGDVVQIHTCGCGANGRWLRSIHGWIEAKSNVTVPSGSIQADAETLSRFRRSSVRRPHERSGAAAERQIREGPATAWRQIR